MEIQIIAEGNVLQYILDPNFENYLPIIPAEVGMVNFTWKAGDKKYFYNFDRLQSFNEDVLLPPILSIETKGKIPRKPKCKILKICLRTKTETENVFDHSF